MVWFTFYIAIPYLIWNQGKDIIGDYYAILLSTAPAFVYTIYTFIKDRQFNVTGLFIVITLLARTIIDLISGNAATMLNNQVYFMIGLAVVVLFTIVIKKPIGLYFFVDTAYLMGYKREDSLKTLPPAWFIQNDELAYSTVRRSLCIFSNCKIRIDSKVRSRRVREHDCIPSGRYVGILHFNCRLHVFYL